MITSHDTSKQEVYFKAIPECNATSSATNSDVRNVFDINEVSIATKRTQQILTFKMNFSAKVES